MNHQKQKLRAGIIGLGVGEQHIAGYQHHPSCEVVALCDMDPAKREMAREKYPSMRVVDRADDLLNDPTIDVISIATYDNAHYEQIMKALEHGKHVFAEKPLVLFPEHAQEIRTYLRTHPKLRLSSNLILRQSPRFLGVKARIDQGVFGELFYVEADYEGGRLHKIVDGWRGSIEGYSCVYGGGVHMIDLLHWLTGDEVVEVCAYGNAIATHGSDFQNFDQVVCLLKFRRGIIGKVTVSLGCVSPHFHPVNLFGTQATFRNTREYGLLTTSRETDTVPEHLTEPYPGVSKGALIPSFIDAILERGEPVVSEEDVFRSLSVCFAIESAVHTGKPTAVEYI